MHLALLLLLLAGCSRPAPPPDLILVTWDTTRADRVGPGAAVPGLTPAFDALAATGLSFSHARTPAPVTLSAHATLLTGLLPHEHGARTNGLFVLGPEPPTLAERLSAAGYRTGAFVSAAVLSRSYGLDRGFHRYDDDVQDDPGGTHFARRTGPATVDAALAWLATLPPEQPAFLWVHLFDAHLPLTPPEPFASQHADPYDAAIAFLDAQTARLLTAARARRPDPLVAITADHGEGLGEHGERTHGYFAYDSTLRVPLLFAGPGIRPGRSEGTVHLGDVAGTLLAALGLPTLGSGLDLQGTVPADRVIPVESIEPVYAYGTAPVFGLVSATEALFDLPTPERYDLVADPGQTSNLYVDADAPRLQGPDRRWPPPTRRGLADAEREQLIALGYLSAGSDGAPSGTADPKDLLPVASLCMRVEAEALPEDVVAEAAELTGRFGPVPMLAIVAADALSALGRPAEARAALEASAAAHPDEERLQNRLALARAAARAQVELEGAIRAALAREPEHPSARFDLAVVLHQQGRLAEAAEAYRQALERNEDVEARLGLARALGGSGDLEGAIGALTGDAAPIRCARGTLLARRLDRAADAAADLAFCR